MKQLCGEAPWVSSEACVRPANSQLSEAGGPALRWLQPWPDTLVTAPEETLSQKHPVLSSFQIHRYCEIIDVCCFQSLSFGALCYQGEIANTEALCTRTDDIQWSGIRWPNSIKMSFLPNFVYRLNASPKEIPVDFFIDVNTLTLKYKWKGKGR